MSFIVDEGDKLMIEKPDAFLELIKKNFSKTLEFCVVLTATECAKPTDMSKGKGVEHTFVH